MLILERPKRDEWRLPKGHIDPGEDAPTAAMRETAEESGFANLEITRPLGVQRCAYRHKGRRYLRAEFYFLMQLAGPEEIERPDADQKQFVVSWLEPAVALDRMTYEGERNVLRKALVDLLLDRDSGSDSGSANGSTVGSDAVAERS